MAYKNLHEDPEFAGGSTIAGQKTKRIQVPTKYGTFLAIVQRETTRPIILTVHDIGTNYETCFHSFCAMVQKGTIFSHFCFVHVVLPGQNPHDPDIEGDDFEFDDLAACIYDVRRAVGIDRKFVGFGVGAGSRLLLKYTLDNPNDVRGLILSGPDVGAASWSDMGNRTSLSFPQQAMMSWVKKCLLYRYFGNIITMDLQEHFNQHFEFINWNNISKLLNAYYKRPDMKKRLKEIQESVVCYTGEGFGVEQLLVTQQALPRCEYLVFPQGGTLLTESHPQKMIESMKLFLNSLGYQKINLEVTYPLEESEI